MPSLSASPQPAQALRDGQMQVQLDLQALTPAASLEQAHSAGQSDQALPEVYAPYPTASRYINRSIPVSPCAYDCFLLPYNTLYSASRPVTR